MAEVNYIQKKGNMSLDNIVKFQILLYCYLNNITISESDLDCLSLLAIEGKSNLTDFCYLVASYEIFSSAQSVRNSINKCENKNLIIKKGKSKKTVYVNPNLEIQTEGNIFIDIKFLRKNNETKEV